MPLSALFISDLVLGFYAHMEIVYLSFALIVCIGLWLQKHRTAPFIAGVALFSSLLFFVTTNFGVWAFEPLYPKTLTGLLACYTAAIPFFQNTLGGDLLYTASCSAALRCWSTESLHCAIRALRLPREAQTHGATHCFVSAVRYRNGLCTRSGRTIGWRYA